MSGTNCQEITEVTEAIICTPARELRVYVAIHPAHPVPERDVL